MELAILAPRCNSYYFTTIKVTFRILLTATAEWSEMKDWLVSDQTGQEYKSSNDTGQIDDQI